MKNLTKTELAERYAIMIEANQLQEAAMTEFADEVSDHAGESVEAIVHARTLLGNLGDGNEVCEHVLADTLRSIDYALRVAHINAMSALNLACIVNDDDNDDEPVYVVAPKVKDSAFKIPLELWPTKNLTELADVPMDPSEVALVQAELARRDN